ncbi:MAG: hypothetical protein M1820_010657, partial [Bogoriella megaspora]
MAPGVHIDSEDTAIVEAKLALPIGAEVSSSTSVPFGGDDQWFYNPDTKQFDLSRSSDKKLLIEADDGIRNHSGVLIDPEKTVLVIIDMQNYFI